MPSMAILAATFEDQYENLGERCALSNESVWVRPAKPRDIYQRLVPAGLRYSYQHVGKLHSWSGSAGYAGQVENAASNRQALTDVTDRRITTTTPTGYSRVILEAHLLL